MFNEIGAENLSENLTDFNRIRADMFQSLLDFSKHFNGPTWNIILFLIDKISLITTQSHTSVHGEVNVKLIIATFGRIFPLFFAVSFLT